MAAGTHRAAVPKGIAPAICATLWLSFAGATPAAADEALIAVATNFAEAAAALRTEFERETGHTVVLTSGSTGKLYAQITQGAPFHALLSADQMTPERLEAEGHAAAGTRFTYAIGRLALWSADPQRIGADGRSALLRPELRFVAIANPDLAPYGIAARETLEALGLWQQMQPKIVMGQNIGQTHSMVATGAAEVGFVALSALQGPHRLPSGSRWDVPQELYTPIRQDAVLLAAGREHAAAQAFLAYLRSPLSRTAIEAFGYRVE